MCLSYFRRAFRHAVLENVKEEVGKCNAADENILNILYKQRLLNIKITFT